MRCVGETSDKTLYVNKREALEMEAFIHRSVFITVDIELAHFREEYHAWAPPRDTVHE